MGEFIMWGILFATLVLGFALVLFKLREMTDILQQAREHMEAVDSVDADTLTTYEMERLAREEQFDDRIKQLKDEIANTQQHFMRSGVEAEELHPLVRNLPHNIINETNDALPDVEYSN